jgi:hypothetical protein
MKPESRIHNIIKWTGAAVTTLLVVMWIASRWWDVAFNGAHLNRSLPFVQVYGGRLVIADRESTAWPRTPKSSALFSVSGPRFHLMSHGFEWEVNRSVAFWTVHVRVPLWCLAGLSGLVSAAAWRLDTLARRRARIGLCPKCN